MFLVSVTNRLHSFLVVYGQRKIKALKIRRNVTNNIVTYAEKTRRKIG